MVCPQGLNNRTAQTPSLPCPMQRFVVLVLDTASHYAVASPGGQLAALFDLRGVTMRNLPLAAVGATAELPAYAAAPGCPALPTNTCSCRCTALPVAALMHGHLSRFPA